MHRFSTWVGVALMLIAPMLSAAEELERELQIAADSLVKLENQYGEVEITGWDEPTIRITGSLDEKVEELILEQQGKQVLILVRTPDDDHHDHSSTRLMIKLPRSVDLDATTLSAELSLTALQGPVRVETVSGDITASKLSNSLRLESISGDIELETATGRTLLKSISGDIRARHISGELEINSVSGDINVESDGPLLRLESVSGDAKLQLGQMREIRAKTVSGDLMVNTAMDSSADLRLVSVSGDAELKLLGEINARFTLAAQFGGDIVNRLNDLEPDEGNIGSHLNFSEGEGRARVKMTTVSGTIEIQKAK